MANRSGVRRTPTLAGATLLLGFAAALLGCSGHFEGDPLPGAHAAGTPGVGSGGPSSGGSSGSGNSGGKANGASGGTTGSAGSGGSSGSAGAKAVAGVVPITRAARLSHAQYRNTVAELFGIDDDPTSTFAPDAQNGFLFESSLDYAVDNRLGPQYRAAAEALAARAVSDAAVFERIVPCEPTASGCSGDFIANFGEKAFRRPLGAAEAERFATLFAQGPSLVASGDDFRDGVSLVVEAMLQAPQFLYRAELSNSVGSDGLIGLDSWEIASRLSYFVWNSMPDAALFDSARAGGLSSASQVQTAIERMLSDPRATRTAVAFHAQAWKFDRFSKITPDADTYPNAPSDIVSRVRLASERFVEEVVKSGGGLAELLTAPYAYADSELAPLYGKDVSGALARIDFDAGERKGILMQVGYLASNAYSIKTDPIHRGLFIVRDVLCRTIDDPPPGASQTPLPATDTPPATTREEIELLTGRPTCTGCHVVINPPGFAFEGFDAVGQLRSRENGNAVDTTGEIELDGAAVTFDGASELVSALAASAEAQRCYAARWLTYAYGRNLVADDEPASAEVAAGTPSVEQIFAAVAKSRAFVKRAPNEVDP